MLFFVSRTGIKLPYFTPAGLKKAGLSTALLMLSLSAQAASSSVAEQAGHHVQSLQQDGSSELVQGNDESRFNFPHWPQDDNRIIPPPPPGPYTSSALSDYSVVAPSSAQRTGKHSYRRPVSRNNAASVPMEMFSPDIPWPNNLRPEQRMPNYRQPDKSYQYAQPSYGPAMNSQNRNYNYTNRQALYPDAMNNSRWMPTMGMAPPGPYNSRLNHGRLNYAPNYGSYYNPRYSQPMINNNATNSTKYPYR